MAARAAIAGTPAQDVAGTPVPAKDPARAEPTAAEASTPDAAPRLPAQMSPGEVRALLARDPEAVVLDVREPEEWVPPLAPIEGAHRIPLGELKARLHELEGVKDRPVVLVCRTGRRSEIARRVLVEAGFADVANMSGGMVEWRRTE